MRMNHIYTHKHNEVTYYDQMFKNEINKEVKSTEINLRLSLYFSFIDQIVFVFTFFYFLKLSIVGLKKKPFLSVSLT